MKKRISKQMIVLHMRTKKKIAFIGIFPSRYRAEVVAVNLGWSSFWVPEYNSVRVNTEMFNVLEEQDKVENSALSGKYFRRLLVKQCYSEEKILNRN